MKKDSDQYSTHRYCTIRYGIKCTSIKRFLTIRQKEKKVQQSTLIMDQSFGKMHRANTDLHFHYSEKNL